MIDSQKIEADFTLNTFRVKSLEIETSETNDGVEGQVHFNFDYNLNHRGNSNNWKGEVEFIVNCFAEHDEVSMFDINLAVIGKYSANSDLVDEELFLNFLEHNGITMLIPLTRSFLQMATSQWGIGPPILFPSINVMKLVEEHNKKEK